MKKINNIMSKIKEDGGIFTVGKKIVSGAVKMTVKWFVVPCVIAMIIF